MLAGQPLREPLPKGGEGGLMLRARNRFDRNPYFHFHPMHSTYSLIAALVLIGLVAWMMTWLPR